MDYVSEVKGRAVEARNNKSYSPHSGTSFGAALLMWDDTIFSGGNVEISGRDGVHAEQMVVYKAASEGYTDPEDFRLLALSGDGGTPHVPCGMCLHTLGEFTTHLRIIIESDNGWVDTDLIDELPRAWCGRRR